MLKIYGIFRIHQGPRRALGSREDSRGLLRIREDARGRPGKLGIREETWGVPAKATLSLAEGELPRRGRAFLFVFFRIVFLLRSRCCIYGFGGRRASPVALRLETAAGGREQSSESLEIKSIDSSASSGNKSAGRGASLEATSTGGGVSPGDKPIDSSEVARS